MTSTVGFMVDISILGWASLRHDIEAPINFGFDTYFEDGFHSFHSDFSNQRSHIINMCLTFMACLVIFGQVAGVLPFPIALG